MITSWGSAPAWPCSGPESASLTRSRGIACAPWGLDGAWAAGGTWSCLPTPSVDKKLPQVALADLGLGEGWVAHFSLENEGLGLGSCLVRHSQVSCLLEGSCWSSTSARPCLRRWWRTLHLLGETWSLCLLSLESSALLLKFWTELGCGLS